MSKHHHPLKRFAVQALILLCCFVMVQAPAVSAQESKPTIPECRKKALLDYGDINNDWWDPCGNNICGSGADLGNVKITGDNAKDAFNYFVQQFGTLNPPIASDLAKIWAAAIVGNFYHESAGVNPAINQTGGGPGRGIAQWTDGQERWAGVKKTASDLGVSEFTLTPQLQYAWKEIAIDNWGGSFDALKKTTTIEDATIAISDKYERPNAAKAQNDKRIAYAKTILAGGGSPTTGGGASAGASCGSGAVNCNQPTSGISEVRKNVVCIAQQELQRWQSGELKPGDGYFKYSENNVQDWCADFASWVYNEAKQPIGKPSWRVASVAGIKALGMSNSNNFHWHDKNGYTPKPGDLAIHDLSGSHVNIVTEVNGGKITMIGGNQGKGPYPSGSSVTTDTTTNDISGYVTPD